MKHVLFTEPEEPQAGERLTIYYNPSNTCLAGHGTIYLTAGFNRWGHRQKVGPIQMIPPGEEGEHFRVSGAPLGPRGCRGQPGGSCREAQTGIGAL